MRTIFYVHDNHNFRCPFSEMLSKLVLKMYQKREGFVGLVYYSGYELNKLCYTRIYTLQMKQIQIKNIY
jgi:hypothetical protein